MREGGEIVIRVPGVAPEALVLPALEKPLGAIRLVREPGLTILRVEVAPEVPFEASHEPGMLTVVFGEQPAPELRGPVTPELYAAALPDGRPGTGAPDGRKSRASSRRGGEGIARRARHAAPVRVGQLGRRRRAGLRQPGSRARPATCRWRPG